MWHHDKAHCPQAIAAVRDNHAPHSTPSSVFPVRGVAVAAKSVTVCDLVDARYGRRCSQYRRVVQLPFDSGPVDQSQDRRDGPEALILNRLANSRLQ